jgi:large subunit ribosomal protein L19
MSRQALLDSVNKAALKTDLPRLEIGDTINVHFRIVEGQKERIQIFQGVLIGKAGGGINEFLTVRRVVDDYGIERIIPLHSPMVAKYEIVRHGDANRAKLYYLRDRSGKSYRLRDRRKKLHHVKSVRLAGQELSASATAAAAEAAAEKKA